MISTDDGLIYGWKLQASDDPQCENCGRSLIARFGGNPDAWCDACNHEFSHLAENGMLVVDSDAVGQGTDRG